MYSSTFFLYRLRTPLLIAGFLPAILAPVSGASPGAPKLVPGLGKVPIYFEENRGQVDSEVKFLARSRNYRLYLTESGVIATFPQLAATEKESSPGLPFRNTKSPRRDGVSDPPLQIDFVGVQPTPRIVGVDALPGKANYFRGGNPDEWHTNISLYGKVEYLGIYPGIDALFYGKGDHLEFDFIIDPGVDPSRIQLKFEGQLAIELDDGGDLILRSAAGSARLVRPRVLNDHDGDRIEVSGRYVLLSDSQVGFEVDSHDPTEQLIIDPELLYSTYLGGTAHELGMEIGLDSARNIYVSGVTSSADFPLAGEALRREPNGEWDVFVLKLDPTGTTLLFATYLGSGWTERPIAMDIHPSGAVFLTGQTASEDFPTTEGAFQTTYGGQGDGYVSRLSSDGSSLEYSTFLGSALDEYTTGIAVDTEGCAYVTGTAHDPSFPTTQGAYQESPTGEQDVFVTKLAANGEAVIYSTFIGGTWPDIGGPIAVDGEGFVYLTGSTHSTDFPVTSEVFQSSKGDTGGRSDAFVTKLNPEGTSLIYSSYLGGSDFEVGSGIDIDNQGNVFVSGPTWSLDFPMTRQIGSVRRPNHQDLFVTKVRPDARWLDYSTMIYGCECVSDIAVDSTGSAYVAAGPVSADFPTSKSFQNYGGDGDAFVLRLSPSGSNLVYSSFLGGSSPEGANLAVDNGGNVYLTGTTWSTDFPVRDPFQNASAGGVEIFIAKVSASPLETYFAQLGNGGGITSDLVLANPSTVNQAAGMIRFFDDSGQSLPIDIAGTNNSSGALLTVAPSLETAASVAFSVPPLGMVRVSTTGEGEVRVGSALVESDHTVSGVIRFSLPGIGIAGVGASEPVSHFITPVRREAGGINTGVAVANTEEVPVNLNLSLRDTTGQEVVGGAQTIESLPGRGHLAQFINELFPSADTADFEGTLVVEVTGGRVAATALELGSAPGQFTTLPVSAVN